MTANTCGFSRGLPGLNRLNQIFLILILKRFQRLCRGDSGPMSHFSDYSQLHEYFWYPVHTFVTAPMMIQGSKLTLVR